MSTEYSLYKEDACIELSIDEMSNKLSFDITPLDEKNEGGYIFCTKKMTPEEMAKIFLQGLTICSYWMDNKELVKLIKDHLNEKIDWKND